MLKSKNSRYVNATRPTSPKVNRPVPALSAETVKWENEIYADPTGGSASRY
jgi:hypothetical protein